MSERKIHCEDMFCTGWSNCGSDEHEIILVGGYVFARLKDEFKCKRCKKKEDSRQEK